jgi:hypothetical protein
MVITRIELGSVVYHCRPSSSRVDARHLPAEHRAVRMPGQTSVVLASLILSLWTTNRAASSGRRETRQINESSGQPGHGSGREPEKLHGHNLIRC